MGSKKGKVIMKVLRVQRVKIIGEAIKDPTTVKVVSGPRVPYSNYLTTIQSAFWHPSSCAHSSTLV